MPSTPARDPDALRRLLHRWFVVYNPLYLVSAALVLVGLNLVSQGVATHGELRGPLGVAILAELYAGALLGGVAILLRRGLTRPAVLLALIAILYQGDLTLHTETCGVFGARGLPWALAWLGLFGVKLRVLARLFGLRLSLRTRVTALTGAAALTLLPFTRLHAEERGLAVAFLLVALGVALPRTLAETVESRRPLDAWGQTVLRRVVVATFALWGVMLALHVVFWSSQSRVDPVPVALAFVTLYLARQRSELRVWLVVVGGLLVTVAFSSRLPVVALFAACTFAIRAFSRVRSVVEVEAVGEGAAEAGPYRREPPAEGPTVRPTFVVLLERVATDERLRLLTGALFSFYLVFWSAPVFGSDFPHHLLSLDLALVLGTVILSLRGARLVIAGTTSLVVHGLVVSHTLPVPTTALAWGVVTLTAGFVILFGSVFGTAWLSRRLRPEQTVCSADS